ncbi:M28 family peptidase [bacterium]|nr:MAG: M28 family peptidase [bacterium]
MRYITLIIIGIALLGCQKPKWYQFEAQGNSVPKFSADTAHKFVQTQVEQGSRVPGSEAHLQTKNWLVNQLKLYAGKSSVGAQKFKQVVYGDTLTMYNIIASINPGAKDRIMLCAHWDSRPRADEASTKELQEQPVIGADDGASGVAVLLELARVMSTKTPEIGVDIILFDGEDYGKKTDLSHYFLGSRQWANNPPVKGYNPRFAILLDMVGAKGATFYREEFSASEAPYLVDGVWKIADELGFSDTFINKKGAPIADDHYILNSVLPFPTIDIINHGVDARGNVIFPKHWHTEHDTMDIIDKNTLEKVGSVLLELIYNRIPVQS